MQARPLYEAKSDRDEEREIARTLSLAWSCAVVKLPTAYNLDYAATRNNAVIGWLELKRRHCGIGEYPNIFLSLHKVFAAHKFHEVTKLPNLFVVQFDGCLAYADMLPQRPIGFRGRTDRGDWQDQEPVSLIPIADFKVIP